MQKLYENHIDDLKSVRKFNLKYDEFKCCTMIIEYTGWDTLVPTAFCIYIAA